MQSFEDKLRSAKSRPNAIFLISQYMTHRTLCLFDGSVHRFILRELLANPTKSIIEDAKRQLFKFENVLIEIFYDKPYHLHKTIKSSFDDDNIDNRYLFATLNCKDESNQEAIGDFFNLLNKIDERRFHRIVNFLQDDFMDLPFDADTIGSRLTAFLERKTSLKEFSDSELLCAILLSTESALGFKISNDDRNIAIQTVGKTKNKHILEFIRLYCNQDTINEISEINKLQYYSELNELKERCAAIESENKKLKIELEKSDSINAIRIKIKNGTLSATDVIKTLLD